jgi:hypothetical protein
METSATFFGILSSIIRSIWSYHISAQFSGFLITGKVTAIYSRNVSLLSAFSLIA